MYWFLRYGQIIYMLLIEWADLVGYEYFYPDNISACRICSFNGQNVNDQATSQGPLHRFWKVDPQNLAIHYVDLGGYVLKITGYPFPNYKPSITCELNCIPPNLCIAQWIVPLHMRCIDHLEAHSIVSIWAPTHHIPCSGSQNIVGSFTSCPLNEQIRHLDMLSGQKYSYPTKSAHSMSNM